MKRIFTFSLILCSIFAVSQTWCPPGAAWNFTFAGTDTNKTTHGYSEIRYKADVLLDGITWKHMAYRRYAKTWQNVSLPVETRDYYTAAANGVIRYRLGPSKYDTLADFTLRPGKGWTMTAYKPDNCNDNDVTVMFTVVDTGHVMINNVNLLYQKIVVGDSATAFSNTTSAHTVYERMGDLTNYIFRYVWGCSTDDYQWPKEGNFTCYWDDTFPVYVKSGATCNYNATGISKNMINETSVSIFPNPSSGVFYLSSAQNLSARLYSASGAFIMSVSVSGRPAEIDLRSYPDGLYFLQYSENENTSTIKLVKD